MQLWIIKGVKDVTGSMLAWYTLVHPLLNYFLCKLHRFYDVEDLMPLIRKCCNLTCSYEHVSPDPTLLIGCVPQVYALDELQDDIIQTFLAGKKRLQKPSSALKNFCYKNEQIKPLVSKTMSVCVCVCSMMFTSCVCNIECVCCIQIIHLQDHRSYFQHGTFSITRRLEGWIKSRTFCCGAMLKIFGMPVYSAEQMSVVLNMSVTQ